MAELESLVGEYLVAKHDADLAKKRKDDVARRIREVVGEGSQRVLEDGTKVAVSATTTERRVSAPLLKKNFPDVWERVLREVRTSPRLTVTPAKKEDKVGS